MNVKSVGMKDSNYLTTLWIIWVYSIIGNVKTVVLTMMMAIVVNGG